MSNIVQGPWQNHKIVEAQGPMGEPGPNGPPGVSLTSDQIAMLLEPAILALEKQQKRDDLISKISIIILSIFAIVVGIFIITIFITAFSIKPIS